MRVRGAGVGSCDGGGTMSGAAAIVICREGNERRAKKRSHIHNRAIVQADADERDEESACEIVREDDEGKEVSFVSSEKTGESVGVIPLRIEAGPTPEMTGELWRERGAVRRRSRRPGRAGRIAKCKKRRAGRRAE